MAFSAFWHFYAVGSSDNDCQWSSVVSLQINVAFETGSMYKVALQSCVNAIHAVDVTVEQASTAGVCCERPTRCALSRWKPRPR